MINHITYLDGVEESCNGGWFVRVIELCDDEIKYSSHTDKY